MKEVGPMSLKPELNYFNNEEQVAWDLVEAARLLEEMYDTVSRLSNTTIEPMEYVAD